MLDTNSIFDLKSNSDELSNMSNGAVKYDFRQCAPSRDVSGSNFSNGQIAFRYKNNANSWLVPSRCYLKMRFRLTNGAGVALSLADGIAPNMLMMGNLFQSMEKQINGKTVSRISDFVAATDALEHRLEKSASWMDTIGASTNWTQSSQSIRQSIVSRDGQVLNTPSATNTVVTTKAQLGLDPLVNLQYIQATGQLIFSLAAGGVIPLPPDIRTIFTPNSYIVYTATTTNPNSIGVRLKIRSGLDGSPPGGVDNIYVESLLPANEAGNAGLGNFSRVVVTNGQSPSRQVPSFELTWKCPLSFYKQQGAFPAIDGCLLLNPDTLVNIQKKCIESVLGQNSKNPTLIGGAPQDFSLSVIDCFLYNCVVEGPSCLNSTYLMQLENIRCQSDKIQNASYAQKTFSVSPSTHALTVAFSDIRAGVHTSISASKFKCYEAGLNPILQQELKLNRLNVSYAGMQLINPDANPSFIFSIEDFTTQRYIDSQINSGSYDSDSPCEDIITYHDRGSYYHLLCPKDGSDSSTNVTVYSGFDPATDVTNMRMLLFDHSRTIVRITVQSGQITEVQCVDV